MTASDLWRRDLKAWAIPPDLLENAEGSPWDWPEAVLARMRRDRETALDTPTLGVVCKVLGEQGTVIDVGAGSGRLAVPLARLGHRVTAVEKSPLMLEELGRAARGLPIEILAGSWPDAARRLPHHDVAVSAHVVYDVADIGPFLAALHGSADAVVIECSPDHPWSGLAPFFRALHGLERPAGPTFRDLLRVITEVTGAVPAVEHWKADRGLRFRDREELLTFYRRRLVLPPERTGELEALLEPEIRSDDGALTVGDREWEAVTVWWRP